MLLFVTLGPIKIVGPFAQLTRDADESRMKQIAVRAFVIAVIAVVVGGFVGKTLLENWQISVSALTIAGGIIFVIVGLSLVLEQYQPAHAAPPPLPEAPMAAALRLAFPTVVTPYGIAAVIVAARQQPRRRAHASILAILIGGDGAQPAGDSSPSSNARLDRREDRPRRGERRGRRAAHAALRGRVRGRRRPDGGAVRRSPSPRRAVAEADIALGFEHGPSAMRSANRVTQIVGQVGTPIVPPLVSQAQRLA